MIVPSEEEILQLVAERQAHRQARRFAESDSIRERLRSMGVELYDKEKEWRSRDGRRGELFTACPVQCPLTDPEIHEYIVQREDARTAKHWQMADSLRDELRRQGVELDDRSRTWRTATGRTGTYSGQAQVAATQLSDIEIRALVAERERARTQQDFVAADALRMRLLRMGVELFDSERTWRTSDGRQGVIVTGGTEIVQCMLNDEEIRTRIAAREEARSQKDWDRADAVRDELRRLGVELWDSEQKWRATDGRRGTFGQPQQQQHQWPNLEGMAGMASPDVMQAAQEALHQIHEQYAQQYPGQQQHQQMQQMQQLQPMQHQLMPQEFHQPQEGGLTDASIQALLAGREAARAAYDFETADAIEQDLKNHGVEVFDGSNMWKALDGRQGSIAQVMVPPGPPAPMHMGATSMLPESALRQLVAAVSTFEGVQN